MPSDWLSCWWPLSKKSGFLSSSGFWGPPQNLLRILVLIPEPPRIQRPADRKIWNKKLNRKKYLKFLKYLKQQKSSERRFRFRFYFSVPNIRTRTRFRFRFLFWFQFWFWFRSDFSFLQAGSPSMHRCNPGEAGWRREAPGSDSPGPAADGWPRPPGGEWPPATRLTFDLTRTAAGVKLATRGRHRLPGNSDPIWTWEPEPPQEGGASGSKVNMKTCRQRSNIIINV